MKLSIKKKIVTGLVLGTIAISNIPTVFAASQSFTRIEVDGDDYTYVVKKDKTTSHKYVKIKISNMYKEDGSDSLYKKSKAKLYGYDPNEGKYVRCTSKNDWGKTVVKGEKAKFTLLSAYQKKDKTIKYYAKGNNPDLDCQISGTMYVDEEE